jgi:hypothetical protein
VTRPKRFRGMELTEEDVEAIVARHSLGRPGYFPGVDVRAGFWQLYDRTVRLLPLWRKWSIERERLWFTLIGLGLDIEGDERDMSRAEMRRRIEGSRMSQLGPPRSHVDFVLRELDR